MSLSRREQRLLAATGDEVRRSDPRLASKLAIFTRLTAGQDMPGGEQMPEPPLNRLRAALAACAAAGRLARRQPAPAPASRAGRPGPGGDGGH